MFSKCNLNLNIQLEHITKELCHVSQKFPELNSDYRVCLVARFEASVLG